MAHALKTGEDVNSYLHEARKICDAMPQAISIDNYIDAHSMNPNLVLCGKLGIARSIVEAERNSKLYTDIGSRFDQKRALNTWYLPFFQILTESVLRTECDEIFDNVSFVIFNYDRCWSIIYIMHYRLIMPSPQRKLVKY
jgi:hypothetical protein